MTQFLGSPKVQYFKTGRVDYLVGGKVYTYDAGTTNPRYSYPSMEDALNGTNPNTNPVILDSRGEASIVIRGATKVVLADAQDNIIWTEDNIDQAGVDILDAEGNELVKFVVAVDAVNEITISNAAVGDNVRLESSGEEADIGLEISSTGDGTLYLDGGTTGDVEINSVSTGDIRLRRAVKASNTLEVDGAVTFASTLTTGSAAAVSFIPVGTVLWRASWNVPAGWLECNGTDVSRTTYAALFAEIGTTYGAGNGTTTFNLPNQARRTLVGRGGTGTGILANTVGATGGAETHVLSTPEIPSHTHTINVAPFGVDIQMGIQNSVNGFTGTATQSSQAAGGGGAHNNMQPSLVMMMMIRAY